MSVSGQLRIGEVGEIARRDAFDFSRRVGFHVTVPYRLRTYTSNKVRKRGKYGGTWSLLQWFGLA